MIEVTHPAFVVGANGHVNGLRIPRSAPGSITVIECRLGFVTEDGAEAAYLHFPEADIWDRLGTDQDKIRRHLDRLVKELAAATKPGLLARTRRALSGRGGAL